MVWPLPFPALSGENTEDFLLWEVWTHGGAASLHYPPCPDTTQKQHCPAIDWSLKKKTKDGGDKSVHLLSHFCSNLTKLWHRLCPLHHWAITPHLCGPDCPPASVWCPGSWTSRRRTQRRAGCTWRRHPCVQERLIYIWFYLAKTIKSPTSATKWEVKLHRKEFTVRPINFSRQLFKKKVPLSFFWMHQGLRWVFLILYYWLLGVFTTVLIPSATAAQR